MKKSQAFVILMASLLINSIAIELPLLLNEMACTAIMSSFDPIKIDIRFPSVPNLKAQENFKISIAQVKTFEIAFQAYYAPQTTLRKSIDLVRNVVYQLCISFESDRLFEENATVYIPYTQAEDFQSLIGNIQIPAELAKQVNLKEIFMTSKNIEGVAKVIASHQSKERELQDEIVTKNIHKSQRILTLSFIECLVIILSGVYQICALRKFLKEKNLY